MSICNHYSTFLYFYSLLLSSPEGYSHIIAEDIPLEDLFFLLEGGGWLE